MDCYHVIQRGRNGYGNDTKDEGGSMRDNESDKS